MALSYLILLPFIGSAIAALLPANARNTESTLAGAISVFCVVQVALLFPETQNRVYGRKKIWYAIGRSESDFVKNF